MPAKIDHPNLARLRAAKLHYRIFNWINVLWYTSILFFGVLGFLNVDQITVSLAESESAVKISPMAFKLVYAGIVVYAVAALIALYKLLTSKPSEKTYPLHLTNIVFGLVFCCVAPYAAYVLFLWVQPDLKQRFVTGQGLD